MAVSWVHGHDLRKCLLYNIRNYYIYEMLMLDNQRNYLRAIRFSAMHLIKKVHNSLSGDD